MEQVYLSRSKIIKLDTETILIQKYKRGCVAVQRYGTYLRARVARLKTRSSSSLGLNYKLMNSTWHLLGFKIIIKLNMAPFRI